LDDPRSFGSWLLSIAGFVCHEWIRRKQTGEKHRDRLAQAISARSESEPDLPIAEAVAALPPDVQHLLALRYDLGMTSEEIAGRVGKTPEAVRKILSRAHEELRKRLGKE
jgi:RNA polymerase sigma factor (sigma-70 family)